MPEGFASATFHLNAGSIEACLRLFNCHDATVGMRINASKSKLTPGDQRYRDCAPSMSSHRHRPSLTSIQVQRLRKEGYADFVTLHGVPRMIENRPKSKKVDTAAHVVLYIVTPNPLCSTRKLTRVIISRLYSWLRIIRA